jgi:transposase InsO family protein
LPVAPNVLAQDFRVAIPDRVWVGDITYVPTGEGGLYLAVLPHSTSRSHSSSPELCGKAIDTAEVA